MGDSGTPLLSVTQTRDGVWSVNERGPTRAVRVAKAQHRCRVAILERGGVVQLSHVYESDQKHRMEES